MYPKISDDPEIQAHYESMRRAGESHGIASICATQRPPASLTDREFNFGRHNNNQFEKCPALGQTYKEMAERAGVSTTGRYYVHGLGRYPGDPTAWVKGRGEALELARERNLNMEGMVTHKARPVDPTPDIPLAPDIWEREAKAILEENPGMRYEDAKEKAFELRTGETPTDEKAVVTPCLATAGV